jgi:hypothetical protein
MVVAEDESVGALHHVHQVARVRKNLQRIGQYLDRAVGIGDDDAM